MFCLLSASRSGSVGVVHLIETDNDLIWIENNATAGPYTVVMPFTMFNRDTLIRLRDTNNINGVLLAKNISQDRPFDYSPEDTCPNRYSGYKKCDDTKPWNPFGSALFIEDWPFPMFYTDVRLCLEKYALRVSALDVHYRCQILRNVILVESDSVGNCKDLFLGA